MHCWNTMKTFNDKYRVDAGGCWMWTASCDRDGYGHLMVAGRLRVAHRLSWELHRGPIPDGRQVCHTCDTPACVNPDHLFLGTQRDNMRDCVAKGRMPRKGEDNNASKLTEVDVSAIRADPRLQREIAVDYGVTQPHISAIKRKENWK